MQLHRRMSCLTPYFLQAGKRWQQEKQGMCEQISKRDTMPNTRGSQNQKCSKHANRSKQIISADGSTVWTCDHQASGSFIPGSLTDSSDRLIDPVVDPAWGFLLSDMPAPSLSVTCC